MRMSLIESEWKPQGVSFIASRDLQRDSRATIENNEMADTIPCESIPVPQLSGTGSVGRGTSRALRDGGATRQLGLLRGRGEASGRTPAYPTQLMN